MGAPLALRSANVTIQSSSGIPVDIAKSDRPLFAKLDVDIHGAGGVTLVLEMWKGGERLAIYGPMPLASGASVPPIPLGTLQPGQYEIRLLGELVDAAGRRPIPKLRGRAFQVTA